MIINFDKRDGTILHTVHGRIHRQEEILVTPRFQDEELNKNIGTVIFNARETAKIERQLKNDPGRIRLYKVNQQSRKLLFNRSKPPQQEGSDLKGTIIIDLSQDIEEIKKGFSKSTIKAVKDSETLTFREIGFNDRQLVIDVLHEIEEAKDIELFTNLLRVRAPFLDGVRRMYIVESGGKVVAASVVNVIGDRVTYILGGVTALGRGIDAGDRIMWGMIQDAKNLGYKEFDLGGVYSDAADESKRRVNTFKQRWGGKLELSSVK